MPVFKSTKTTALGIGFLGVLISLGSALLSTEILYGQNKDLIGGAEVIFLRPANPKVQSRKVPARPGAGLAQGEKKEESSVAKAGESVSDEVEDALELGNAARDRTPPDLGSAEKAYRLAWKLDPADPRPFVGLGNVYLDQERYPEAAKAYKEAIRLATPRGTAFGGLGKVSGRIASVRKKTYEEIGDWRLLAAASMLRQDALLSAERELTSAIASSKDARALALLAYDLFRQQRFTEASSLYNEALNLDPANASYRSAVEESSRKASVASAQDVDMIKRLEGTTWNVRENENTNASSTCEIRARNLLKCTPSENDKFLFTNRRWKIQDGFMKIESYPVGDSFCIGRQNGESIRFTCLLGDVERIQVWSKLAGS